MATRRARFGLVPARRATGIDPITALHTAQAAAPVSSGA
jgi:hypothetical protein